LNHHHFAISPEKFFSLAFGLGTRGHSFNLFKKRWKQFKNNKKTENSLQTEFLMLEIICQIMLFQPH